MVITLHLEINRIFLYLKKYLIQIFISYIIAAFIIYFVGFNILCYNNDKNLRADMKQILSEITVGMNYELDKYMASTRILSKDNAIRRTVDFNMNSQLEVYCSKLVHDQDLKNFIITDVSGNILFDSNNIYSHVGSYEAPVNYDINTKEYNALFLKESLYFLSYFPLLNDADKLCGSISSLHSMDDFKKLLSEKLTGKHYIIYPILENRIAGFYAAMDNEKLYREEPMKYTFFCPTDKAQRNFMSADVSEHISGSGIAIGMPFSLYESMREMNIIKAILWTVFLLITATVLLVFWVYLKSRIRLESEIQVLRMEKHDFIKHVNIVNSLAYNSDLAVLKEYIAALGDNISMRNSLNILGDSAISILLSNKEIQAREKGIKFELLARTSLDRIRVNAYSLCSMLENLIDNAMEASEKASEANRYIEIEISQEPGFYVFRVMNTGTISERNINKIFEYGYTTKEYRQGHGMGLFIVTNIVNKFGGSIMVDCEAGRVCFTVSLPE